MVVSCIQKDNERRRWTNVQQHKHLPVLDFVHPQFCVLIFYSGFLNASDEKILSSLFFAFIGQNSRCAFTQLSLLSHTQRQAYSTLGSKGGGVRC